MEVMIEKVNRVIERLDGNERPEASLLELLYMEGDEAGEVDE